MPTDITGRQIANAMKLRRFENTVARDVTAVIDAAGERVQALLFRLDPAAVMPGNRQRRLQALGRAFDKITDPMYAEIAALSREELVSLAQIQEAFAASTLQATIGPTVSLGGRELGRQFWRSVVASDPIQGDVMRKWWSTQERHTQQGFRRAVQMGLVNGETTPQIVRRVRGRAVGRGVYKGGVMSTTTRQATALVRTAINQISVKAQFETYKQYDDVTSKYLYRATLDSRTTPICASLDGNEYPYGEGPLPPQHWNCRSTVVPVVDFEGLGLSKPPEGKRASVDGPVPADQNYSQWLRKQDKATQVEFFGSETRANLFRGNKMTLNQLVASDGQFATLEELGAT